ncbi:Zinc knuckle family protein [Ditylenchus destructor]|uniref:Zinc knuckle family protein n=1 Tax=Ditylenchus destructor TaxID=166010 RepID=A0AAD4NFY7_9BILA|nr:Zinc knuckle family protein [Ditylenchus destructor]
MSGPYSAAIDIANKKAKELLSDKISTEIPDGMIDVSDIKSLRRKVIKTIENATFLIDEIQDNRQHWQTVQHSMLGSERSTDAKSQQTFIDDSQYPETLFQLKSYTRQLKFFRGELDVTVTPSPNVIPTRPRRLPMLQLPAIALPEFDGKLSEWPSFWQKYKTMIHDVDSYDMPTVHKLHFLKECLKGRAASAISDLDEVEANYQPAIDKLEAEFGNPLAIKQSLYHSLQILKPTTGKRDDLRRFADELDKICSHLIRMGEDLESLLIQELIQDKLPPYLVKILISSRNSLPTGEVWTTAKIRQKLRTTLNEQEEVFRAQQRIWDLKFENSAPRNMNTSKASQIYNANNIGNFQNSNPKSEEKQPFIPTMSFVATNAIQPNFPNCNAIPYSQPICSLMNNFIPLQQNRESCFYCFSSKHRSHECDTDINLKAERIQTLGLYPVDNFSEVSPLLPILPTVPPSTHIPIPPGFEARTPYPTLKECTKMTPLAANSCVPGMNPIFPKTVFSSASRSKDTHNSTSSNVKCLSNVAVPTSYLSHTTLELESPPNIADRRISTISEHFSPTQAMDHEKTMLGDFHSAKTSYIESSMKSSPLFSYFPKNSDNNATFFQFDLQPTKFSNHVTSSKIPFPDQFSKISNRANDEHDFLNNSSKLNGATHTTLNVRPPRKPPYLKSILIQKIFHKKSDTLSPEFL